jgi:hypothetical protein
MLSTVRNPYSIQLLFITYNRRLKAMRKLLNKKDRDRKEDKEKKAKGKKRGRRKGSSERKENQVLAPKDADQRSKATKNNRPRRTTGSMTRMFNYYVEMK